MSRLAFTTNLKDDPELQRQYREYHDNAWPDVVECFRELGVKDIHIWQRGLQLIMVAEVSEDFNHEAGLGAYLDMSPRCREWESIMDQFQDPPPDAPSGQKWVPLEHLYSFR